jgi:hypothetical protein
MAILSANTNPKLQEERKAAENAKAILGMLTPSTARADRTIFVLRYAADRVKTSTLARLESRYALDGVPKEKRSCFVQLPFKLDGAGSVFKRAHQETIRC